MITDQIPGVVAAVGHHDRHTVALRRCKPVADGSAEAVRRPALQHLDMRIAQRRHDLARTVTAGVVDDDDLELGAGGSRASTTPSSVGLITATSSRAGMTTESFTPW